MNVNLTYYQKCLSGLRFDLHYFKSKPSLAYGYFFTLTFVIGCMWYENSVIEVSRTSLSGALYIGRNDVTESMVTKR